MRYTFQISAEQGARFTASAAQSLIGQRPAMNMREHEGGAVTADLGRARVVAAEVVDDGRALAVTVEQE